MQASVNETVMCPTIHNNQMLIEKVIDGHKHIIACEPTFSCSEDNRCISVLSVFMSVDLIRSSSSERTTMNAAGGEPVECLITKPVIVIRVLCMELHP